MKVCPAKPIRPKMFEILGCEMMQDSTVTKYTRALSFREVEKPSERVEQADAFKEIDFAILEALGKVHFLQVGILLEYVDR